MDSVTRASLCVFYISTLSALFVGCDDDKKDNNGMSSMMDGMVGMDAGDAAQPGVPTEDYVPGADDSWPACISDNGEYSRIMDTISSGARVQAFEDMSAIFTPKSDPSTGDFDAARLVYAPGEGLASRVGRRYDPHFPKPDGVDCNEADKDVPKMHPDYCVGPGWLEPIINDAFNDGQNGQNGPSRLHGARIEAAILWFLYASQYKESYTCTDKAKDCDSAYAYYMGTKDKGMGIGLSRYIREVDAASDDAAWNGILAIRCWRDLDDGEIATNLGMRDVARNQLDRAALDGVASIVLDRLDKADTTTGDEQAYYWAFVQTLGPALYRAMDEVDSDSKDKLEAELGKAANAADFDAAMDAIESVFPL